MTTEAAATTLNFTSEDWEKICDHFQNSVMAKTPLSKLAQDIGKKWPVRGKEECPSKYTMCTLDELKDMTEFYGKGSRLNLLYAVLSEIKEYDMPFNEMADQFDEIAEHENDALKTLKKLGVPEDLSVEIMPLSRSTLELCEAEGIKSIRELVEFCQRSAQTVIVGGEFQELLNALLQENLDTIRHYVPIRKSRPGLDLAEAIKHLAESLSDSEAGALLKSYKAEIENVRWLAADAPSKLHQEGVETRLKQQFKRLQEIMPDQAATLRQAVDTGEASTIRFFAHLNNPDLESLSQCITKLGLNIKAPTKSFLRILRK